MATIEQKRKLIKTIKTPHRYFRLNFGRYGGEVAMGTISRDQYLYWSTKDGLVSVDDKLVNMSDLGEVMYVKISRDPKLTVSLKADENSLMETLTDIHSQLKKAQALKLNYSSMSQINN